MTDVVGGVVTTTIAAAAAGTGTVSTQQLQPSSPDDDDNKTSPSSSQCCSRVDLTEADLAGLSVGEWALHWRMQDAYVRSLEQRLAQQEGDANDTQLQLGRTRGQLVDSQQREKVLVRRLAAKEQEMQDIVCQLTSLKSPPLSSLRSTLLDPAVNSLLLLLRAELTATHSRLEDTQNELAAWKFTPDSNTGKRLMTKCRLLHQENEELGRMTSGGRIALLEGELELQKGFSEEVRQSQKELDGFLGDLEEDVEGMQSTIMYLQQELRGCRDRMTVLEKENSLQLQELATLNGRGARNALDLENSHGELATLQRYGKGETATLQSYGNNARIVLEKEQSVGELAAALQQSRGVVSRSLLLEREQTMMMQQSELATSYGSNASNNSTRVGNRNLLEVQQGEQPAAKRILLEREQHTNCGSAVNKVSGTTTVTNKRVIERDAADLTTTSTTTTTTTASTAATLLLQSSSSNNSVSVNNVIRKAGNNNNNSNVSNGESTNGEGDGEGDDDEDVDGEVVVGGGRTRGSKRVRRSSVLSIDYNDEDMLVISTNGDVAMSSDAE